MSRRKSYAVYIGLFAAYIVYAVAALYIGEYINRSFTRRLNPLPSYYFSIVSYTVYAVLLTARGQLMSHLDKRILPVSLIEFAAVVLIFFGLSYLNIVFANYYKSFLMLAAENIYALVYGIVKNRRKREEI